MTLLRERERSDDNDARAFLLSNAAEERSELLRRIANREKSFTTVGNLALRDVAIW
jgi:hypothetical protein